VVGLLEMFGTGCVELGRAAGMLRACEQLSSMDTKRTDALVIIKLLVLPSWLEDPQ
jgi:hypothetical protein